MRFADFDARGAVRGWRDVCARRGGMLHSVDVVVQWVRIDWTKHSRGGAAAAVRNAVPVAFELPDVPQPVVHEIVMRDSDDFDPRSIVRDLPVSGPRLTAEGVSLHEDGGLLRVRPVIPTFFDIPPRRSRPPAVTLRRGEWLCWQLNYRFSSATGMADWSYHLHTLNLSYGLPDRDTFQGTPTRYVDERGICGNRRLVANPYKIQGHRTRSIRTRSTSRASSNVTANRALFSSAEPLTVEFRPAQRVRG